MKNPEKKPDYRVPLVIVLAVVAICYAASGLSSLPKGASPQERAEYREKALQAEISAEQANHPYR